MGDKERRKPRRPEKEEQFVRIAEIVEQKRPLYAESDEEFRREFGHGGVGLVHSVMLEVKKEGLSTALVFGYFLKEDREKAGLTQGDLGKKIEELGMGRRLSQNMISCFESGEKLGEEFPSKRVLSVIAALGAPDNAFWALMEHYEYTWSESTTELLKAFGQMCLQFSLRRGYILLDAARYSHTLKGD